MRSLRYVVEVLRTAVLDLARRPLSSLLSITAMAVAVFVLAVFLVLTQGMRGYLERWTNQAAIEVFLEEAIREEERVQLLAELAEHADVRRIEEVSAGDALAEFVKQFPDLGDVEGLLGSNPFPSSLRLVPASPEPERVGALVEALRARAGVATVRYDREWLEALARLGRALSAFVLGGAFVLLLAALVTVGSVIRLALDDKHDEVRLMRLIGAPTFFVVGPVLLGGSLLGGIGSSAALLLVRLGRTLLLDAAADTPLIGMAELLLGQGLAGMDVLLLLVLGFAAGAVAAGMAAGRASIT